VICRRAATRKFLLPTGGEPVEAFVVKSRSAHAWVNAAARRAHDGLVENASSTSPASFIVCGTHGALYRPDSGECIRPPSTVPDSGTTPHRW